MIHSFKVSDAEKYGMLEAVILGNFRFWVANNRANGRHQHDGKTWTYNSVQALTELFPYASIDKVRRAIERLVDRGVLVKGCYNESPYDRTAWYAFADEICQLDLAPVPNVDLASVPNVYKETDSKQQIVSKDAGRPATRTRAKKEEVTIQDWMQSVAESGQRFIPSTDKIWTDGVPDDFIQLAWKVFEESMTEKGAKKKDWRAQFRTYVRNDYLKLWAINRAGDYYLTTAGKQAAQRFGMGDLIDG